MANINIFHFWPQETFLHRMDPMIKLICLLVLSITGGLADTAPALTILTMMVIALLYVAKLPVTKIMAEIRIFLLFILCIMLIHALRVPGEPLPLWAGGRFFTREGMFSGLFYGWRIILLLLLSAILTATTTLSALREGIQSILRPVPFVPEEKIATMFSLVLSFIPLLLDRAVEIAEAQKARCVQKRKNPVKRLSCLVYPFLSQAFLYAEEVVTAMEARCYTGRRTVSGFYLTTSGLLCLALTILISLVICIVL